VARWSFAGALVTVALASCGGNELTYVGNADSQGMYFTVPSTWHGYDAKQLAVAESVWADNESGKALLESTTWQTAFDASTTPSADHVFANSAPDAPTAYASVRTLFTAEQEAAGADPSSVLRDLVVSVSTLEASGRSDFALVTDEEISQGSFPGRHLVFRYRETPDGPEQTVNQTAFLDPNRTTLYLMMVRCSTECYNVHRTEIDSAVGSLTLKESGRG